MAFSFAAAADSDVFRPSWQRQRLIRHFVAAFLIMTAVVVVSVGFGQSTTAIVIATAEIPAGQIINEDDVELVYLPAQSCPKSALGSLDLVTGQLSAGPIGSGEIITEYRIIGERLVSHFRKHAVLVPVHIDNPDIATVIVAGDTVSVLAAAKRLDDKTSTQIIATGARVVTSTGASNSQRKGLAQRGGTTLLLALSAHDGAAVAAATIRGPVTVVVTGYRAAPSP